MKPIPATSPLDRPASIPQLRALLAAGVIDAKETRRLEKCVHRELPWSQWLDRGLLALGAILIVAGIGYFFAHNWTRLTDVAKLGLASGAVLAAFAGAMGTGPERFAGKLLLLAASMLVGVFLAVFGQIYQTGADTEELMRAWAGLILPWVLLGRFVPLWLFGLGVANGAVLFWPGFDLIYLGYDDRHWQMEMLLLGGVNLTALGIREWAGWIKVRWLDGGWSTDLLLAATLLPTTIEASRAIFSEAHDTIPEGLVLGGYLVLLFGLVYYFFRRRPSLRALTLTALSACWVLTMLVMSHLLPREQWEANWLLVGLIILAIFGSALFLLRKASAMIAQ